MHAYIYQIFFIHASIDVHWCFFHSLTIVNNAAMNLEVCFKFMFTFIFSYIYPKVKFLGHNGFPGGSEVKASACKAGDPGSIPGSRGSPGEGNRNPLQYSCLENPMGGGAWWATVHGVAQSRTRLSDFHSLRYWVKLNF